MAQSKKISESAVKNTAWAYISYLAGKILNFVTSLILARYLLTPEEFGLMGLCLAAIQYLDLLNTFGAGEAIVSRPDKLEETANAAFVISGGLSFVLFAVGWLFAPQVALFFNEPRFVDFFRLLLWVLPINALSVVPAAILKRSLRFRTLILPGLAKGLAKGFASIGLALAGYGVWSLIWGQIAGELLYLVVNWLAARWRPTAVFNRQVFKEIMSYGGHIMSVGLVGTLIQNVDYLLVGRILGSTALGYYTLAYRLPELVLRSINLVVGKVAFPVLAQMKFEQDQLRYIFLRYLTYIALIILPAGAGLAAISTPLILLFYTDKWIDAAIPMQWISVAIAISALGFFPGVLYKAINRPDILNKLSLIKLPVIVLVLWISTRWGIVGVALGQVVISVIKILMDTVVIQRTIMISASRMLRALAAPFVASLTMGIGVYFLLQAFAAQSYLVLTVLMLAGVGVYVLIVTLMDRDLLANAYRLISSSMLTSKPR